jgi:hypothetical protein
VKIEDENENDNDNDNDFEISEESEENIIINLNKLSKTIAAFLPHECQRASPSVKVVKRLGLCITVEVCVGSTFTSHLLVDCAERASANSFEVGLCRTDTEALLELSV